ncbi:MAG: nitroreductase family protein [Candidatus Cloacimonadota bacterium]|nr:nitroreductase family protein [Candidatus Cloacimonadota bacterium]
MVLNAIKNRYSVRKFKDKKIESEKMEAILEAARLAPSARNIQPWKFIVITDDKKREKLTDVCKGQTFVSEAPATIAVCVNNLDYKMTCGFRGALVDAAIAGEHIALQAAELGLGTCWIGAFHQDKLRDLINMPTEYEAVALLPIGYPDVKKSSRKLKEKQEVISYNTF